MHRLSRRSIIILPAVPVLLRSWSLGPWLAIVGHAQRRRVYLSTRWLRLNWKRSEWYCSADMCCSQGFMNES